MRFGRDAHGIAMGRALPSQRLKADQGDHNQLFEWKQRAQPVTSHRGGKWCRKLNRLRIKLA
jgi:hypothetical protein